MCICVLILIPLFRDYEMPKDLQDFIKYLEYVATCYSIKLCCYQNYSHFIYFFFQTHVIFIFLIHVFIILFQNVMINYYLLFI